MNGKAMAMFGFSICFFVIAILYVIMYNPPIKELEGGRIPLIVFNLVLAVVCLGVGYDELIEE